MPPDRPDRLDRLDALRGMAMVWMAVFHFCFDLNHFGLISEDFRRDPFWTWQRTAIVSLFLFCAGVGQALALALAGEGGKVRAGTGLDSPRFWRRWAQVAGCAVLVSAGSWLMFPRSFIFFGVLHGVAVMLIFTRLLHRLGPWLWLLGLAAVVLPLLWRHPVFEPRWLTWTGLSTLKPVTEDHVPVLPWLGLMLWGLALGRWLLAHRPGWIGAGLPPALHPLAVLGRWSLSFYMLHQPVFIGGLMAWMALR